VWHAEDHAAFGEAQAGSRPGRSAIDVVLQKELTYDLSARTLFNVEMMENDATACFDRMIPSMRYRIKTKIGISKRCYQHTEEQPMYGTGQGSAGFPCFWLLTSIILFNIMAKISHGISFTDPQGVEQLQRTMEAFVDDTDVAVINSEQPYTSQQLVDILQIDAQHWEKLLFTSGGKLELSKCFFYIMHWKFSPEGIPSLTSKDELST
jgi:hypothetical protein